MEDGKYAQISRPLIEQAQEDTGSYEGSMTEIDFAGVLGSVWEVKLMTTLNEYDLRQIKLIEKKIVLFEDNKMNLFDFVDDLIGILNAIESVADSWKNDFRVEINSLEMIQDSIEDGSITRWRGSFKEDIHKSVSKLKKMTTSLLEEYLKRSDPNVLDSAIEANFMWLMCPKCNDAWESNSLHAMVVCPKCDRAFHNPRASQK